MADSAGIGLVRQRREFLQEEKDIRESRGEAAAGKIEGSAGAHTEGRAGLQLWRGFNWNPAEE